MSSNWRSLSTTEGHMGIWTPYSQRYWEGWSWRPLRTSISPWRQFIFCPFSLSLGVGWGDRGHILGNSGQLWLCAVQYEVWRRAWFEAEAIWYAAIWTWTTQCSFSSCSACFIDWLRIFWLETSRCAYIQRSVQAPGQCLQPYLRRWLELRGRRVAESRNQQIFQTYKASLPANLQAPGVWYWVSEKL